MRLDIFLVENGYFDSRTKAKQAIERGEIFVDGKNVTKTAFDITGKPIIKRVCENDFVSLGGFKLNKALIDFSLSVNNFICADVGASTGGFTDCLIKNGAKKVYAVDLNDNLLHKTLKDNVIVRPIIKNARELNIKDFNDERIDLMVCDLSFISATLVLPIFANILKDNKLLILLIKPQFEADEKRKYKNGIIKDKIVRKTACRKIYDCALKNKLSPISLTTAPISEGKNIEYLMLMKKGEHKVFNINEYLF